ncbi:multivesicular body subunit 12Bb [Syngnathus scovelli]|uniref:multivesicular body subunit 12Bb n=1 Tax=Syngnathus scovelli TaxID=161590 RepID=UPI00210FB08A|nr:multivesicular body subunit 12B-like [Syngnathus scovelli]
MANDQMPTDPITAVGVLSSRSNVPDDYFVVAQTTDGSDAALWKDGLFKSKVTRYLCFTRKPGPDVIVDVKLIDIKDALPEGFIAIQETLDTKEPAMKKRRLCVKMSPRAAADTAVFDFQIIAKSKQHLVHYTSMGEINNMGLWYRMGEVPHPQSSQQRSSKVNSGAPSDTESRRTISRPTYEPQNCGSVTVTAMDGVPFGVAQRFYDTSKEMQQVNLMGITIKSLAEIEEEFHYNFSTERSIVL